MSDLIQFFIDWGILLCGFGLSVWWSIRDSNGFRSSELLLHLLTGFLGVVCIIFLWAVGVVFWKLSKII